MKLLMSFLLINYLFFSCFLFAGDILEKNQEYEENYRKIMQSVEEWLKNNKKTTEQACFSTFPIRISEGKFREHEPEPDEEIMRLHKDPERCYKMGLGFLEDVDQVPYHLETAKVWLMRAAKQGHVAAQKKLQALGDQ